MDSFKVVTRVDVLVKKVYGMLTLKSQGIEYKSWAVMLQLYKALVRPHFCASHYRKYAVAEEIQKRYLSVTYCDLITI